MPDSKFAFPPPHLMGRGHGVGKLVWIVALNAVLWVVVFAAAWMIAHP